MAEAVVDQLEAIEIEEEDGEPGGLAALRAGERDLEAILEERAIRQSRQRIVEGGLQQPRLRLAPRGDVGRRHQQRTAAFEDDFVDGELEIVRLARRGAVPLDRGRAVPLLGGGARIEPQIGRTHGEELLARPTVVANRRFIDREKPAGIRVFNPHRLRVVLEQHPVALFRRPQRVEHA